MPDETVSGPAVPLRPSERRRAAKRTAPGPQVVHEAIRREGEDELSRPAAALFWSGVAAGLSMVIFEGTLSHHFLHDKMDRTYLREHNDVVLGFAKGASMVLACFRSR